MGDNTVLMVLFTYFKYWTQVLVLDCKGLIEAKKIKKGRYTTQWDEKDQMLVAKIA
jgi:hypothetical protein